MLYYIIYAVGTFVSNGTQSNNYQDVIIKKQIISTKELVCVMQPIGL